jgi:hypothetical protein
LSVIIIWLDNAALTGPGRIKVNLKWLIHFLNGDLRYLDEFPRMEAKGVIPGSLGPIKIPEAILLADRVIIMDWTSSHSAPRIECIFLYDADCTPQLLAILSMNNQPCKSSPAPD